MPSWVLEDLEGGPGLGLGFGVRRYGLGDRVRVRVRVRVRARLGLAEDFALFLCLFKKDLNKVHFKTIHD